MKSFFLVIMVTCLGDLHIWSVRSQAVIPDGDIGCFTYHEKSENATPEHPYIEEKAAYTEGRNVTWSPRNKRPDKLRDTLRELEELLVLHRCVRTKWLNRRLLQLILNNGIVVTIVVSIHTGDVDKIFIDKSLAGKLSSEHTSDAVLTESYLAVVYSDRSKMDYFYFVKKPAGDKKIEKLTAYEPRLLQVDLPGPLGRRVDRRLVCNLHQDLIACWWPTATGEAQPWSPMSSDKERANLVLLTALGSKFEILTYTKTDCDPLGLTFSLLQPQQILTVEQWAGPGGEFNINSSVYECTRNRVHKVSLITLPVQSQVVCYDRNLAEDKLILGCKDSSLVLYDEYKKVTHITTASLMPSLVRWHPSGTVVHAANARGDLQLFDLTLAPLKLQLVAENISPVKTLQVAHYLRFPSAIGTMMWSPLVDHPENKMAECNDSIFINFDRGPMVMLQIYLGILSNGILSPLSLVNQYIKYRQIDQAISVLAALNWNSEGQTCYACLSAIVIHLLRSPLNAQIEGQLETVLGTFYAPVRPLSEVTVLEYRDPISRLARRFFHQLLRFSRFEKAFLLAVDIGARDLFMDIHYVAKDKGETALAEAARRKADQIDAESLVTESVDEEFTEESDASYSDSEEDYDQAPVSSRAPQRMAQKPTAPHSRPSQAPHPPIDPRFHRPLQRNQGDQQVTNPHTPWQPRYVDMSEAVARELETQLRSELVNEYTEALLEEPILPPPQPPVEASASIGDKKENGAKATSNVKVIHFGIV